MKIEIIIAGDVITLNHKANFKISEIESDGNKIIDIKYQFSNCPSILVIYCSKDEYRDVVINKILEV
jgi:hypothetical protein